MKKKFLLTMTGVGIVTVGLAGYMAIEYACKRQKPYTKRLKELPEEYMKWYNQQTLDDLEIMSDDGLKLKAKFLKNNTDKLLIAVHGYHSNNVFEYAYYLKFYYEMGFSILLPDNRAHGDSEGTWIGFGWLDRLDIIKWMNTMIEKNPDAKIVLHGISMGSATVLNVSGEKIPENVKCIVSDCGFTNVYDQMKHVANTDIKVLRYLLPISNRISKYIIGYNFKEASPLNQVKKSYTPTLFIHGDADTYVPTKMGYQLYEACSADKELLIVPDAPHAESYFVNKDLCEDKIKQFIDKYVK